ncbi:fimbrial protein [Citrobacter sp. Awk 4]|uniref:fimbrial protein n=1 Tax=Citrobacter sp. Awk 4 TaxID=2963955 RepID=UPI00230281AE|nr:fimbrial protein [Citrobacter sp. Awk 4]MDA8480073.1 fimbrial protein [Citrobacter sp. Awk 4]
MDAHASYTSSCVVFHDLTVKPANVTINANDSSAYPPGTLIGEAYVDDYDVVFSFTGQQCSGSGTSTWAYNPGFLAPIGTYSSPEGDLPVYFSGALGIGYAMAIADPNGSYKALGDLNNYSQLFSIDGILYQGALGVKFKVYFVTTQQLNPGYHIITGSNLAVVCLSSSETINTNDTCSHIYNDGFIINVTSGGCDINADTPSTVNLDRINASELPNKGDVGNNVDFTISLKCNAATTINMTLTDPNGGDPENGVLYNDTGEGVAQNVGVQVLSGRDGGTTPQTIHLNESFTVGQADEGQYNIPMSARYYRTSDSTIVGGKVSASVIYELSYQ